MSYSPSKSATRDDLSPKPGRIDYALLSNTTFSDSYPSTQYGQESDELLIPVLLGDMNSNYEESRGNFAMNIDYRETEYSVSSMPDYVRNILQKDEGSERGSLLMVRDTDEKSDWSEIGGLHGKYKWRDSRLSNISTIEKISDGRMESDATDFTSVDPYSPQTEDI